MVNAIQETLVQSIHSLKRRIMRKIKRTINLSEGAIEEYIQIPLLTDIPKQLETLQIHFPIKELQSSIDFDLIVSHNQAKIEALASVLFRYFNFSIVNHKITNVSLAYNNINKIVVNYNAAFFYFKK